MRFGNCQFSPASSDQRCQRSPRSGQAGLKTGLTWPSLPGKLLKIAKMKTPVQKRVEILSVFPPCSSSRMRSNVFCAPKCLFLQLFSNYRPLLPNFTPDFAGWQRVIDFGVGLPTCLPHTALVAFFILAHGSEIRQCLFLPKCQMPACGSIRGAQLTDWETVVDKYDACTMIE